MKEEEGAKTVGTLDLRLVKQSHEDSLVTCRRFTRLFVCFKKNNLDLYVQEKLLFQNIPFPYVSYLSPTAMTDARLSCNKVNCLFISTTLSTLLYKIILPYI